MKSHASIKPKADLSNVFLKHIFTLHTFSPMAKPYKTQSIETRLMAKPSTFHQVSWHYIEVEASVDVPFFIFKGYSLHLYDYTCDFKNIHKYWFSYILSKINIEIGVSEAIFEKVPTILIHFESCKLMVVFQFYLSSSFDVQKECKLTSYIPSRVRKKQFQF